MSPTINQPYTKQKIFSNFVFVSQLKSDQKRTHHTNSQPDLNYQN